MMANNEWSWWWWLMVMKMAAGSRMMMMTVTVVATVAFSRCFHVPNIMPSHLCTSFTWIPRRLGRKSSFVFIFLMFVWCVWERMYAGAHLWKPKDSCGSSVLHYHGSWVLTPVIGLEEWTPLIIGSYCQLWLENSVYMASVSLGSGRTQGTNNPI